jgi:hypothetical protein
MQEITFKLNIPTERYMRYYRGQARAVVVKGFDGRTVQFPADALRPFVTHNGVSGIFVIRFDQNNKLVGIEKIRNL